MKRTELVTKLELVGRALAGNNLIPIFECFAFNKGTVWAYNDALAVIAPCKTDDAFAVNGNTLLGLLRATQAEEVEFTLEPENGDVVIKAGRSTFRLPYFTEKEFLFEEPSNEWFLEAAFNAESIKGLEACLLTASKDQAQPALMGVNLHQGVKGITLYSCDSDSLSRFVLAKTAPEDSDNLDYMMPNVFCEAVSKISNEQCKVSLNKEWARANTDTGYTIYGRLIEVDNPMDHLAEIRKTLKVEPQYVKVPEGLSDALARARVVADPETAKTVFSIQAGRLKLLTSTHMGVVRDTLPLPGHPEVTANVSAALVQRSISLCDEMAVLEHCSAYRQGKTLLQIIGNME